MPDISKVWSTNINNVGKMFATAKANISKYPGGGSAPVVDSSKGVFGGGSGPKNNIDQITISTLGNSTDFGDLTLARQQSSACSNGTSNRGVFGGGYNLGYKCTIDYVTISTPGNASGFGEFSAPTNTRAGCSNGTNGRGLFGGGNNGGGAITRIDYITISTTGNASKFGDIQYGSTQTPGAVDNRTNNRAVFAGGVNDNDPYANMGYVTISSAGDTTNFGNLSMARRYLSGCSNGTNNRGIFAGGLNNTPAYVNVLDYINISSTGNAADFGDLTIVRAGFGSCSSGSGNRGVFGGGNSYNVIDYVTITSTGNAADFGDLLSGREYVCATSNV